MEYKDYYAILGVPHNADSAAIKRAFRGLARQLHPDVNPGNGEAERRFKEVSEAYDVLGNDEKRQMYDQLGSQWNRTPGSFNWSTYFDDGSGDERQSTNRRYRTTSRQEDLPPDGQESEGAFSDFFQQLFNAGPRTRKGPRVDVYESGPTYRSSEQPLPIEISLEEAFWGTSRTIQQGGTRFEVPIPQGARNGSQVRVSTAAGDLLLVVQIKPHATFTPDEANLRTGLAVNLYTALLGGEVHVPTLEGKLALVIPANTQNGRIFRLKGQGMPTNRTPEERGDLLVEVVVELPVPLSEEERRRFVELRRMRPPYR
ncbi:MAG: DnaJ domain-containing protein [Caldilineaceae bacterium]|nr:DnaJ domain-containing protein [Caldilineaceae bacterium]